MNTPLNDIIAKALNDTMPIDVGRSKQSEAATKAAKEYFLQLIAKEKKRFERNSFNYFVIEALDNLESLLRKEEADEI